MKQKIQEFIKTSYPFLFGLLFFLTPFDDYVRALPNILLVVIAIGFFLIAEKRDFKKLKNPIFILFSCFLIYLLCNSLITGHWNENLKVTEKLLLSLALIILAIPIKDFRVVLKAVILSSVFVIIFSLYRISLLIAKTGVFEFGNSQNAIDALIIDRLYVGLICILGVLFSYLILKTKSFRKKSFYWFTFVINFLFVFFIASRIAILILIILIFLKQLYRPKFLKRLLIVFISVSAFLAIAFLLNDNLGKRFFYNTDYNSHQNLVQKTLAWEPRTVIWSCSGNLMSNKQITISGMGFSKIREELINCYDKEIVNPERRLWFLQEKYNTHNQYIDFYLGIGVAGALLFISMFILSLVQYKKQFFPTAFITTLFLFGVIESYFYRQMGSYYFGLILILILFENFNLQVEKNSKKNE